MISRLKLSVFIFVFILICNCNNQKTSHRGKNSQGLNNDNSFLSFQNSPENYVCKVKNILTGLACTEEEIQRVDSNHDDFKTLIREWQKTPEHKKIMIDFFSHFFQQSQITMGDIAGTLQYGIAVMPSFIYNMRESFGRTVWEIIQNNQSFTEVLTTRKFMLTSAMMTIYSSSDTFSLDDNGKRAYDAYLLKVFDKKDIILQKNNPNIPLSESLNIASEHFLNFYTPDLNKYQTTCFRESYLKGIDQVTIKHPGKNQHSIVKLFYLLTSPYYIDTMTFSNNTTKTCIIASANLKRPIINFFQKSHFEDWRMVEVRAPKEGEKRTFFGDTNQIFGKNTLVLNRPFVGFFSTPAFLINWRSNIGNQHRVRINQTLAVALGKVFDGTDKTDPDDKTYLESELIKPNTVCYGCHLQMDVMRGFFMQNYSFYEHALNPPDQTKHPGYYAFHGVKAAGRPGAEGLVQMGELLAKDPDFPVAWVQKLCNYVNSAPCDPEDSEFIRIVEFFKKSNFNWNAMMVEFFSSPLVTYEKSSNTVLKNKGLVSIARKKQLRNVLIFRNNLSEEYERYNHKTLPANKMKIWKDIEDILNSFPDNTYGRGMPIDMYPVEPGFILYKGMKNLCLLFSKLVVGTDNGIYASTSPNDSIKKMVKQFMGVHGEEGLMMEGFLKEHYDAAIQKGHPAMESLQSTFSLACQSPYITGVGI